MPFNSIQFLIFFPSVCICYAFLAGKIRNNRLTQCFLLAVSLYFYACWKPAYLVLILASVTITWLSGLGMEQFPARKRPILARRYPEDFDGSQPLSDDLCAGLEEYRDFGFDPAQLELKGILTDLFDD